MKENRELGRLSVAIFLITGSAQIAAQDFGATMPDLPDDVRQSLEQDQLQNGLEFKGLKVRETALDVIASEDGSVSSPAKKLDQLKGAVGTFSRDFGSGDNEWAVKGALVAPFVFTNLDDDVTTPMELTKFGFAPSVSLHKFEAEDGATDDIDSLIYRAGVFGTFAGPFAPDTSDVIFRLSGSYGTDLDHELSVLGGEFDFELRWDFTGPWAIGYKKSIPWAGQVLVPDSNEKPFLTYELRTWIHGEFGQVNDVGDLTSLEEGSFARIGPAVDLIFEFPWLTPLSFNTKYRYLAGIDGDTDDSSLFEAAIEWKIWEEEELGRQLTAKISYLNGGLDLTGQEAETLLVGLGFTF